MEKELKRKALSSPVVQEGVRIYGGKDLRKRYLFRLRGKKSRSDAQ